VKGLVALINRYVVIVVNHGQKWPKTKNSPGVEVVEKVLLLTVTGAMRINAFIIAQVGRIVNSSA